MDERAIEDTEYRSAASHDGNKA